jgi:hypothetical protein
MASITNQIVANIKKTSTNFNSFSFINSENVVVIDTSNNRIGINQKKPTYSIDISGDTSSNAIRVHDLYINNLATIEEISCNKLTVGSFTSNIVDVSIINFKLITGNQLDLSFLVIHDISTSKLFVPDVSVNFIDVSDNINTYTLNVSKEIITDKLTAQTIVFPFADLSNINIDTSANIDYCTMLDLCSNQITAYEISVNKLYVENSLYSFNEASFNHLNVDGDISVNNMYVENTAIISDISVNRIEFNDLSGNTFNANTIISNGVTIVNNGVIGDIDFPTDAIFENLTLTNIDISNYLSNSGVTDLSTGLLILPEYLPEYENSVFEPGTITFDNTTNILKIFNTTPEPKWNNVLFKLNFATMSLRKDISGNDISYDNLRQQYFIDQSENLVLDTINYPNVKYIPLLFDVSSGDKFDLSNNSKTIEITDPLVDELYEIHASIGIKYLNNDPGDVEPNVYTFGIYPHMNTFNDIKDSIDNSFVHLNNTVVAYDNSFNYANTSMNYIGPLANINQGHVISERSGLNFYISSNKDIKYLVIDQFNATIKQLRTF